MSVDFLNVSIRYGTDREVLKGVTFALAEGAICYLTGDSGSGKTSLIRSMFLAKHPFSGVIRLFDEDVTQLSRAQKLEMRREIGIVFQDFRLIDHLNVYDNIALPLRLRNESEKAIAQQMEQALELLRLTDQRYAFPPTLSGGQQQLVAIARAVIHTPSLVLADEPTGNVDIHMAERIMQIFHRFPKLFKSTVVIATHSYSLIRDHPAPIVQLANGRAEVRQISDLR
ncbi:MAG: ATP-binding cassette domain-containing protein [Alphaproteobacteria bacterium]|nr:ATP-binding cassette domain-containing protein [Alphaproteobacteria bacterium]